jgi:hypothetical protein
LLLLVPAIVSVPGCIISGETLSPWFDHGRLLAVLFASGDLVKNAQQAKLLFG